MNPSQIAVLAVAVVLVLVVVGLVVARKRRTRGLAEKFGPEYERTVAAAGKRSKAEAELEERARRVEKLQIRALSVEEQHRYSELWRIAQERFVDSPAAAVAEADQLVTEVMRARGYPMADFDQRAADISVDYPQIVSNYRSAHDLALRSHTGKATTEDLRQAMVHYRTLFEDLRGASAPAPEPELVGARKE